MTRPLPEPSPAALAKALARQKADLERFPAGAVVRIIRPDWLLLDDGVYALRPGELHVITKAAQGQVTLLRAVDGRQITVGQDTLKQCAEVVT